VVEVTTFILQRSKIQEILFVTYGYGNCYVRSVIVKLNDPVLLQRVLWLLYCERSNPVNTKWSIISPESDREISRWWITLCWQDWIFHTIWSIEIEDSIGSIYWRFCGNTVYRSSSLVPGKRREVSSIKDLYFLL
jgi:hypothetical protein